MNQSHSERMASDSRRLYLARDERQAVLRAAELGQLGFDTGARTVRHVAGRERGSRRLVGCYACDRARARGAGPARAAFGESGTDRAPDRPGAD